MHAIDKRLAFLALTTPDIQLAVLAHRLGAGQRLQCCHDVTARIACHHHVERIHGLEIVALAKTERACRHHHFVDGGGLLAHLYREVRQLAGVCRARIVLVAHVSHLECHLARLRGVEGKPPERVGQASVYGSHDKDIGAHEPFLSVADDAGNGGLGRQLACCHEHEK